MREILFRGKRCDNGRWVNGSFFASINRIYIFPLVIASAAHKAEIIPETVGQFTGLADENGKQIFEGDIVEPVLIDGTHKGFSWGRMVVVFDRGAFGLKSRRGEITPMCNYAANVQFKVWGNIHDNPELMEVTE